MNYVNIFLTTEQLETLDAICEQKTSQGVN